MVETNPNGANQHKIDPRQALCWSLYIDPNSETFGEITKSAIKAGYSPKSARLTSGTKWFMTLYAKLNRIKKAEQVLDETLDLDTMNTGTTKKGDTFDYIDSGIVRAKTDVAKFILEKTNKEYQPRKELDITSQGDKVVGITYVIPTDKDDSNK